MNMYRHWTGLACYSELVKSMADERGAYWLIDAIASHRVNPQLKNARKKDERFHDMEIWVLQPDNNGGAVLMAVPDTTKKYLNKPYVKQDIPYTDFDFQGRDNYKLYCGYTLLPNPKGGEPVAGFYLYHPSEY